MTHDLNIENGKASMMYVGEAPWHGLGTKLDGPVTQTRPLKRQTLGRSVITPHEASRAFLWLLRGSDPSDLSLGRKSV